MSKFEISKARLTEIIKEEYQALNEDNALTRTIHRWAEEAKEIPAHLTVARMVDAGDFDGALEMLEAMKAQAEFQAMQSGDMAERLTPDQLEIDEVELGKQRREGLEEAHCNTAAGTRDDEDKLKNPDKADLDGSGDLSPYEKKRSNAIEKAMKKKLKEESVQSIRDLIKQELKSL
jgi:hypothetical protein